jgi:hypothetical protein
VISAAITAAPWGLAGPRLSPFIFDYPGNSVAAMAVYWVTATEKLLAFQAASPQASSLVDGRQVPVHLIPAELRKRIDQLHTELGYPPLAG